MKLLAGHRLSANTAPQRTWSSCISEEFEWFSGVFQIEEVPSDDSIVLSVHRDYLNPKDLERLAEIARNYNAQFELKGNTWTVSRVLIWGSAAL